jgi:hypothetical protein
MISTSVALSNRPEMLTSPLESIRNQSPVFFTLERPRDGAKNSLQKRLNFFLKLLATYQGDFA